MSAPTNAQLAAIFQNFYSKGLEYVGLEERPAVGTVPKRNTGGGPIKFKIQYSSGGNASHTASVALAGRNFNGYVEGTTDTKELYSKYEIRTKVIVESMTDRAIVDEVTSGSKSCLRDVYQMWERAIFNSAGGWSGVVASVATDTVTLTRRHDAQAFQEGEEVVSSETDGLTGSLQAGSAIIASSNGDDGTIVATTNWTTAIPGLDAGDFLFKAGNFGKGIHGLEDWIPTSAAGLGTAFLGVTRSVNPIGLAGHRSDFSGWQVGEAIQRMSAHIKDFGGDCDTVFMSNRQYSVMLSQAEGKSIYTKMPMGASGSNGKKLKAPWSYSGATVTTPAGELKIVPTHGCPDTRIYVGKMDPKSIVINFSGKELVNFDQLDGNKLGRSQTDFSHDIRAYSFGDITVEKPNNWGVITVSAP